MDNCHILRQSQIRKIVTCLHTFHVTSDIRGCPLGRCDKIGRSLIYSATIYLPCVTPTKRCVISEMLLHVVYTPNAPYFITWSFFHAFPTHFCKILKESNVGLFQASKISHMLPQIKFLLFQKKSIFSVDPWKALRFVGELHKFCNIKVWFLDFFLLSKVSYSN